MKAAITAANAKVPTVFLKEPPSRVEALGVLVGFDPEGTEDEPNAGG